MSKIAVGKKIPAFKADATSDETVKLSDLKGNRVVVYFYPKDSTPGCTTEGQDFRDDYRKFRARKTYIFGMYGRKMMGIERSTFLLDEKGVLRREWRKVKVKGHVEEVLDAIKEL